eukprot:TRINITY_DN67402_c6_g13_i1.p1 TRINITY_DN67402_c6_g13~~TRINITY_DN67402_c6_g13_i1.p1  ORF type:complete len:124 (+),score=0.22 TRINITY_DN67402_c6_g13_i1:63-434(+)
MELEYCQICERCIPKGNLTLHQLRCRKECVPGASVEFDHDGSGEWFDYIESKTMQDKDGEKRKKYRHTKKSGSQTSSGSNTPPNSNTHLKLPEAEETDNLASDGSEAWFDHIESNHTPATAVT